MGEVRVLVQGITNDYDAFSRFMQREAAFIEESEPGTLLMEIFADASSGNAAVHEVYKDADAFIEHSESLMTGDRFAEFAQLFEVKRMTFLTEIDDQRVGTMAQQLRAIQASQVAGFARGQDA